MDSLDILQLLPTASGRQRKFVKDLWKMIPRRFVRALLGAFVGPNRLIYPFQAILCFWKHFSVITLRTVQTSIFHVPCELTLPSLCTSHFQLYVAINLVLSRHTPLLKTLVIYFWLLFLTNFVQVSGFPSFGACYAAVQMKSHCPLHYKDICQRKFVHPLHGQIICHKRFVVENFLL